MRGAVEKRKATLAAKKAAQVAAEQRIGAIAPRADMQSSQREMGARPVENPTFVHGYHNAYPHQPEQMQMPPQHHQHHQQPHPHPADFTGVGVPFQS